MEARVKEILSWYDSENPGTRTNLARIMNHGRLAGTGRFVILPVDQGFEHGPARSFAVNPGGYDPTYHFRLAIEAGCNAYAAPLGFLEAGAAEFAGDIPLILKMNNHDVLNDEKDYEKAAVPISTLADRVRHVVQSAFASRRIVIFSGGATNENDDALYDEYRAIRDGGGFGSIIGRNSFQRAKPRALEFLSTVMKIYSGELK